MKSIFLGDRNANICLVQAADAQDQTFLEEEFAMIQSAFSEIPLMMAALLVDDWNRDLSPWPAPAVFGKDGFGDGAKNTLNVIITELLPKIQMEWLAKEKKLRYIIGGYSLAGLFALWSVYQTDCFSGCAAVSPSVWFPDWIRYAGEHPALADVIYLSLGKKEEKTRNPVMARVGECIVKQHELLAERQVCLEWNEGNHFTDPEGRCTKGFVWCVRQLMEGGALT